MIAVAAATMLAVTSALAFAASPAIAPAAAPVPCSGIPEPDPSAAPEGSSGFAHRASARGSVLMAASANPLATDAAYAVLARGGSAVDAVVAAQMMLTLVEPQSSGIGGGAFLLTYQAASGQVDAWDGRETAPMAANEHLFLGEDGRPLPFYSAAVGGRAVGVPGAVRMLEAAHRQLGRTSWPELVQPAIDTALAGFEVGSRLHTLISVDRFLQDDPQAAAYFHDGDGEPVAAGGRLRNPALARSLQLVATQGSRSLHSGSLAAAIVDKVRGHPRNPGLLTLADLASYEAKRRTPVCAPWLRWIVCGMPPPSSGGLAVAQMLGILEALHFEGLTRGTPALVPDAVHLFSEAGRLAYADRARFGADSDFVEVPSGLLERGYLRERAAQIGERSMRTADPGWPAADGYPEGGTSHVSAVDAEGNAAALTTSVENAFGSRQMVEGFMLNNQLTDFSFVPDQVRAGTGAMPAGATAAAARTGAEGEQIASGERGRGPGAGTGVANRLQPGKRPRSSMAPTLVFERLPASPDDPAAGPGGLSDRRGRLVMVTGSPGGAAIINYVAKTLIATLQDGLDPREAIGLANIGSRNGPTELERGRVEGALVNALEARGHQTRLIEATSGVQSIIWRCGGGGSGCAWVGAADPRREGTARGH